MDIDQIINELQKRVAENTPISPASWCEAAMRLEVLATNLDDELAAMQAIMEEEEAKLVGEGSTSAKARATSKLAINYQEFLKLKAKIKRIDSFIITARKRSSIREDI